MTVRITQGVAYVTGTPTGGNSQTVRVNMASFEDVTIPANVSGSTRTSWLYIKLDPAKLANPAVDASDVATLIVSDSSNAVTDDGTTGVAATYKLLIGKVTVANGAVSITNANITDSRTQTGAKTLDAATNNAVLANQLSTSAITLGYASITANGGNSATTATLVTGLTTTVTIPAGGRKVKITVHGPAVYSPTVNDDVEISIWDGTVGSGTRLAHSYYRQGVTNQQLAFFCQAIVTPSAGSKTYNVGLHSASAVAKTLVAEATSPAFILVEAI